MSRLGRGGLANLSDRVSDIARRCGDLTPLAQPVRQILFDGNRANKVRGLDPRGVRYARLSPYTLRVRPRPGNIPFVTTGDSSLIIRDCYISVRAGVGQLSFTQSWPNTFWIEYHRTPTYNRPARDPFGYRQIDINDIKEMMGAYITQRPAKGTNSSVPQRRWWQFWR
jgi:hypothetical protein